jgi:hypothetical protein
VHGFCITALGLLWVLVISILCSTVLAKLLSLTKRMGGGRNKNRHKSKKTKGNGPAGKAAIFGAGAWRQDESFPRPNAEREILLDVIKQHVRKKIQFCFCNSKNQQKYFHL